MKYLALVALLFASSSSSAFEIKTLTFEGAKIYNKRDPQFPNIKLLKGKGEGERWTHHINLSLDMDLISTERGAFYWDQEVVGRSTTSQYREVWWDFEFGINVHTFERGAVSFFHHHKSEHTLELARDTYPLEDYYGIRLCFIGTKCRR